MRAFAGALAALTAVALQAPTTADLASDPCAKSISSCGADQAGAFIHLLGRDEVLGLPSFPGDTKGPAPQPAPARRYEYLSLPDCDQNNPNTTGAGDLMCARALKQCPPDQPDGTRLRIWQRLLAPPAAPTPWKPLGVTCHSDLAPGTRPRLTLAMITQAALRTPWAEPILSTEPTGELTLVNLPTYYRLTWSPEGHQPGETDSTVLLGIPVQIRPQLAGPGLTYDFGDGHTSAPTTSTGGGYPTGPITHTYTTPGTYRARVNTTWTAQFSLDGGRSWDPITATVAVPGPATTITVTQAKAILVTH